MLLPNQREAVAVEAIGRDRDLSHPPDYNWPAGLPMADGAKCRAGGATARLTSCPARLTADPMRAAQVDYNLDCNLAASDFNLLQPPEINLWSRPGDSNSRPAVYKAPRPKRCASHFQGASVAGEVIGCGLGTLCRISRLALM